MLTTKRDNRDNGRGQPRDKRDDRDTTLGSVLSVPENVPVLVDGGNA